MKKTYEDKECWTCERIFTPSSNHRDCPACRARARKNHCSCGNPKQNTSLTCYDCSIKYGADNANWKGGKTKHKAGYTMVRVPEHPRSVKNGGYVFEHILVMEDILGRLLVPGENVHHKNGVKDDNRAENLELWLVSQPSGQRASDMLAWAHEIIELYEPDKDLL